MHNVNLKEQVNSRFNYRTAQRVKVNMPVTIVLSKGHIYQGNTADFSEAGILIRDYVDPELQANRLIGVGVRGFISDKNDEDDCNHFLMRVTRHNGNEFAVKF